MSEVTQLDKACGWFKIMLSLPTRGLRSSEPTTKVAKFHYISGATVYGIFGLLLLCGPALLHYILRVDLDGRSKPYIRLLGVELLIVAFNYLITGRAKLPRSKGDGRILASVAERLILTNVILVVNTATKALPLVLGLLGIIVDSLLAIVTFIIWYKTTHGASVEESVKETFEPLTESYKLKNRKPSFAVHIFGFIKFAISIVFALRPQLAQKAFALDVFQNNAGGYLGAFFGNMSRSAWHKIYMGKVGSLSFSIGNVFSHFAVKIPLLVILVATKQIELGLFVFLGGIDVLFGVILLVLLCIRGLKSDDDTNETKLILQQSKSKDDTTVQPTK